MGHHVSGIAIAAAAVAMLVMLGGCTAIPAERAASSVVSGRQEVMLRGAGVDLGGILFRPADAGRRVPAVVVLHGWAERGVPGAPRVESAARRLSERGYVAVALSMRGWPPSGGRDDCGLEQPDDVVKATDWLARLPGVREDRVGALGYSQGGQVALLAAARTKRLKGVVAYFPVTDIQRWQETTSHAGIRDIYVPQVCGSGRGNSPVHAAPAIEAAVLLIHGDRDTRVPTDQSLRMRDALRRANRGVERLLIPGGGHGFTGAEYEQTWAAAMAFFDRHLGPGG